MTGHDDRCPLCRRPAPLLLTAADRNFAIAAEPFRYHRCPRCGVVFLANVPADLERHYPAGYFPLRTGAELAARQAEESFKLDFLPDGVDRGRLVEVGPGEGAFAAAASEAGFDVNTIEMDERNCEHLRDAVGVGAVQSARPDLVLRELPPSRAIAMWHVLEHLPDPFACLRAAAANLEQGGALILATPNPQALQFQLLRARWPHLDAPRHLALAPAFTLVGFLAGLGLRCTRLTTTDPGGRHWNWFGWRHALAPPARGHVPLAGLLGLAAARVAAPVEHRGLHGTTYSAAFVKSAG